MNILYTRVSTLGQKNERQKINKSYYDLVIEDECSGIIPFAQRVGGKKILEMLKKNEVKSLSIWTVDRLSRNIIDSLSTIEIFNKKGICIHFLQQGLKTLKENGKIDSNTMMMISLLTMISEMERNQIKERQYEGIQLAKEKGIYTGRKKGAIETDEQFLEKHKKSVELLDKGIKLKDIAKMNDVSLNTITKIKKLSALKLDSNENLNILYS